MYSDCETLRCQRKKTTDNEPFKSFRQGQDWSDLVFRRVTGSNADDGKHGKIMIFEEKY